MPKDVNGVRRFLGLASYYRRFIPQFAHIASPLHALLKNTGKKFEWNLQAENAFQTLRRHLTSTPILAFPNFKHPFVLTTDASDLGVAAILSQEIGEKLVVIAYASRGLSQAEKN